MQWKNLGDNFKRLDIYASTYVILVLRNSSFLRLTIKVFDKSYQLEKQVPAYLG